MIRMLTDEEIAAGSKDRERNRQLREEEERRLDRAQWRAGNAGIMGGATIPKKHRRSILERLRSKVRR